MDSDERRDSSSRIRITERSRLTGHQNLPSLEPERKLFTANRSPINLVEPAGFWAIGCDYMTRDEDGLTEMDRAWLAAKEIVSQGIFLQASCYTPGSAIVEDNTRTYSTLIMHCYVETYLEFENVKFSADEFRKRIHYPFPMYLKTNRIREDGKRETLTKYLYCPDGDFYEYTTQGFKLLKFSRLTS